MDFHYLRSLIKKRMSSLFCSSTSCSGLASLISFLQPQTWVPPHSIGLTPWFDWYLDLLTWGLTFRHVCLQALRLTSLAVSPHQILAPKFPGPRLPWMLPPIHKKLGQWGWASLLVYENQACPGRRASELRGLLWTEADWANPTQHLPSWLLFRSSFPEAERWSRERSSLQVIETWICTVDQNVWL